MKESVRDFIENNILALEEDIELFLYLASVQLSIQDVNTLCSYLDTAKIEYEKHVPAVIENLVRENVALQRRRKVNFTGLVNALPSFNSKDYAEFSKSVADAVRKVYPNKVILPNIYGITYVMERV